MTKIKDWVSLKCFTRFLSCIKHIFYESLHNQLVCIRVYEIKILTT